MLFAAAPVMRARRLDLVAALKEGLWSAGAGTPRRFFPSALVVVEIALALMLLGGASVMIRSFLALRTTDPGFATENLLTVQLVLPETR